MSTIFAIDPGPFDSAYCLITGNRYFTPVSFGKIANAELLELIQQQGTSRPWRVLIEMVVSYGMPVGAEVFETCVWIGRFVEKFKQLGIDAELVKRLAVKVHHCGSAKAKDANIIQALVDRYAPGEPNRGKGTKKAPGFFFGFRADIWQAFALAVYAADNAHELVT